MTRSRKNWIWVAIILIIILLVYVFINPFITQGNITTDSFDAYLSEQDAIVSDMMEHMAVEASGNAAIDYLKGMIPHHESAIAMSERYLKYGSSN